MPRRPNAKKRPGIKDAAPPDPTMSEGMIDLGNGLKPLKLNIRNFVPRTLTQAHAKRTVASCDLTFLIGPAGTAKTTIAAAQAVDDLKSGRVTKIVLTRANVEAADGIGFLPGPQPLSAKILTPSGWTTMGELKLGDYVIGKDGKRTEVVGVFPKGLKAVYKINTTDETSTECCEDHLWLTTTAENRKRRKPGCVKTTKELMASLYKLDGNPNHHLPRNEAVEFYKTKLPLAPYTLGVLLGDGTISSGIAVSSIDKEILQRVATEIATLRCTLSKQGSTIGYSIVSNLYNNKPAKRILLTDIQSGATREFSSRGVAAKALKIDKTTLASRCETLVEHEGVKYQFLDCEVRWQNPVKNILETLGLNGTKAWTKFIPEIYKYSNIADRLALLRGLMDTDGCVKANGECSYTTTSKQLALDVIELVQSLGGRALLRERNKVGKCNEYKGKAIIARRVSYEFNVAMPEHLNPFHVPRKGCRFSQAYMHGVGIKSIEYAGEKEVQCISVDNAENLYITDQYIVTHNTAKEKMEIWCRAMLDALCLFLGKQQVKLLLDREIIELTPVALIRGQSICSTTIIVDEIQNLTPKQLKLLLTRIGEGSRMVTTCDPEQCDLADDVMSACEDLRRFEKKAGIGFVDFTSEDITRSAICKMVLSCYH